MNAVVSILNGRLHTFVNKYMSSIDKKLRWCIQFAPYGAIAWCNDKQEFKSWWNIP